MKNKWLVVDKVTAIDPTTINNYYQKLKLTDLNFEALNWLFCYQHKNLIKKVFMKCIEKGIIRPLSMQYIITNFNFMEKLYIESSCYDKNPSSPISQFKLIPNQLSHLKTLHIGYISDHPNNVLNMFSEIPTIKNLHIDGFDELKFPQNIKWKLEKLIVPDLYSSSVDNENCMQFLLSQQSTLKKLSFPEAIGFTSFIIRNLPNLESLSLGLEMAEDINAKFLIKNGQLQRLLLQRFFWQTDNIFKIIINHYNKIKYLFIHCSRDIKSFDGKFEYVTDLALKGTKTIPFLKGSFFPNLKVLFISIVDSDDAFNADDISNEAIKNIQKLCLEVFDENEVFDVLKKCPQINHFNLNTVDWRDEQDPFFVSSIDKIIDVLPQLKCLGITNEILVNQDVKYNKLLGHIKNKNLKLMIYEHFLSMIAEDWGREDADIIDYWK